MAEYRKVLRKILKECRKYSFALDKKPLELFYVLPEQDESGCFEIKKENGMIMFYLGGNYFANDKRNDIAGFESQLKKFNVSPEKLAGYFVKAIKKPLGEHLAEKKLASLEKELLS